MAPSPRLLIRRLGLCDYGATWRAMRAFTDRRDRGTADELWLLEHPPVFTLGQAGRAEHLLNPGATPVLKVDRGGQATYHGPGQLIAYLMLDLRRRGLGVKGLVALLEGAVVELLGGYGIAASLVPGAPGVYVEAAKVASLGLRVRRGCSYHGLALNVDTDLEPFGRINPCGYPGLAVTSLKRLGASQPLERVAEDLAANLAAALGLQPQRAPALRLAPRSGSPSQPVLQDEVPPDAPRQGTARKQ